MAKMLQFKRSPEVHVEPPAQTSCSIPVRNESGVDLERWAQLQSFYGQHRDQHTRQDVIRQVEGYSNEQIIERINGITDSKMSGKASFFCAIAAQALHRKLVNQSYAIQVPLEDILSRTLVPKK